MQIIKKHIDSSSNLKELSSKDKKSENLEKIKQLLLAAQAKNENQVEQIQDKSSERTIRLLEQFKLKIQEKAKLELCTIKFDEALKRKQLQKQLFKKYNL